MLWASGRKYFYNGDLIAEATGGNIYKASDISIYNGYKNLSLSPLDIESTIKNNQDALFILENEALDFIEHTYNTYRSGKKSVEYVAVAFSGGKDSQAVLDLISRVIPPDDDIAAFTDTSMELPAAYKIIEETKQLYNKLYPTLKFKTAKTHHKATDLWKIFGPPSRIQRWCCSVCKTSPFARHIKNITSNNKRPRVLVFEGVRGAESTKRRQYNRTGDGVKHINIINCRPIFNWNETEVYLYLFHRNIKLNEAYRYGLQRVGCNICPFTSEWSEYIKKYLYPDLVEDYINIIYDHAKHLGIENEEGIRQYVAEGKWKRRSGGRGNTNGTSIDYIINKDNFEAIVSKPRESFIEWLKSLGNVSYHIDNNNIHGEIKVKSQNYNFAVLNKDNNKQKIVFENVNHDKLFLSKIKSIINKSAFCMHCGTCEVECPSGALQVSPKVNIKSALCVHCGNCIISSKGCIVATSTTLSGGNGNMQTKKTSGVDRYSTFGIEEEWLRFFFNDPKNWLVNNQLGSKQITAMVHWLKDAEVLDYKSNKLTKLGEVLTKLFQNNEKLVWLIIWINLFFNSKIVQWYIKNTEWHREYSKDELFILLKDSFDGLSDGTLNNALTALIRMLNKSSLGTELNLGQVTIKGNKRFTRKDGLENVPTIAIAYLLYRYASASKRYAFTVSDFIDNDEKMGAYNLFGLSRDNLENILRSLQENRNSVVRVDLTKGLDNINLREDLNYISLLELLSEEVFQ